MKKTMKQTYNSIFRLGVETLNNSDIDDAEFDARCLLEHALGIDTSKFFIIRNDVADSSVIEAYKSLLHRRCSGEPLQYILGKWEFYSNQFFVGEGVLIPRPETEILVDEAIRYLNKNPEAVVVDFCSGTGCIAITVAKLFPNAEVYAVEKYDEAYSYLLKNIKLNDVKNITTVKGDIFNKNVLSGIKPDLILSNPPYVRSADISDLSCEVQSEPHTALDGGIDGYDFYRILSDYWFNECTSFGSAIILECAEDQGDKITEMLSVYSADTKIVNDFNGLQRIVSAYK